MKLIASPARMFHKLARRTALRFLSAHEILGLAVAAALAFGTNLPAQNFSIDWFKIAGGGGTSTGGVYSVSGTIGQPDAGGPMTGGSFSLVGGFWALPTLIQTPDAPTLHITNAAPGFARIWWTPPTPGFTLQSADSLSPTNWVNAPTGTNNPVTVPATLPAKFYRLFKP
ncbi:MAG: hypothetical protein KJ070_22330 [Verrucomicrobia bacterium]|nr:hypothetical protein [Verrucomicrobiota bacterium]